MASPQDRWSKLYDSLPDHPKIVAAGGDAAWLYVCGQCYSSRHLTDGAIPKSMVSRLTDRRNPTRLAQKLVEVGLWEDDGDSYVQHDFSSMQRTREQVESEREQARSRQQRARARHAPVTRDTTVTHAQVTVADTEEEKEVPPLPPSDEGGEPEPVTGLRADGTSPRQLAEARLKREQEHKRLEEARLSAAAYGRGLVHEEEWVVDEAVRRTWKEQGLVEVAMAAYRDARLDSGVTSP